MYPANSLGEKEIDEKMYDYKIRTSKNLLLEDIEFLQE
jgi:hypothetical protein